MRGVRRSARGESSRKAADQEVEPFTLCAKMSHLTRTASEPCRRARGGAAPARRTRPFSAFELVSVREAGRAGGAGFSAADRAYLGRQHIPTKGPWGVDDVDSEAYVSQFSADGSLLIAGFRGSRIRVYDAEKGWKIHKDISCRSVHWTVSDIALSPDQRFLDDVNAVTFADESGNVLYSGSDDSLCKVWDRRCLSGGKSAGILTGHLDGVTFINSRGDGRYFISNCKDQRIKLWDIRKMSSVVRARPVNLVDWDYRWMSFPSEAHYLKHPYDQSVATYRGHSVLQTLIRCYFSPVHSTGQRYIYTGSSGKSTYL